MFKGALAVPVTTALFGSTALVSSAGPAKATGVAAAFRELASGVDETHHVADGYEMQIVMRWGDPLAAGLARVRSRASDA